jgi:hypothetical protein
MRSIFLHRRFLRVNAFVLLVCAGLSAFFLVRSSGGAESASPPTREQLESVQRGMSEREVVSLLGAPTWAEGVIGALPHWDDPTNTKRMYWHRVPTQVQILFIGGAVRSVHGVFDAADTTPSAWTQGSFRKLRRGMSHAQVRTILGPAWHITSDGSIDGMPANRYFWKRGPVEILARFKADQLHSASGRFTGKATSLSLPECP